MREVAVGEAGTTLESLLDLVERGEEVLVSRNGRNVARLIPASRPLAPAVMHALIEELQRSAARTRLPGPDAARAADFLYGEDGLPA